MALLLVAGLQSAMLIELKCRTVCCCSYTSCFVHPAGCCLSACPSCCRSQTDKIFSQQSALGKAHEEAQLLREQLETWQAQQAVIEAEITRQVCVCACGWVWVWGCVCVWVCVLTVCNTTSQQNQCVLCGHD